MKVRRGETCITSRKKSIVMALLGGAADADNAPFQDLAFWDAVGLQRQKGGRSVAGRLEGSVVVPP
jgi:hypothetical protein